MQLITVSEIVDYIFSRPPLEMCTFKLLLSHESAGVDLDVQMFPYLMSILMDGAKRLFGDAVHPQLLNEAQFDVLQAYMMSLGYKIRYNYTYSDDGETPMLINIWFEQIKVTRDCRGKLFFE